MKTPDPFLNQELPSNINHQRQRPNRPMTTNCTISKLSGFNKQPNQSQRRGNTFCPLHLVASGPIGRLVTRTAFARSGTVQSMAATTVTSDSGRDAGFRLPNPRTAIPNLPKLFYARNTINPRPSWVESVMYPQAESKQYFINRTIVCRREPGHPQMLHTAQR